MEHIIEYLTKEKTSFAIITGRFSSIFQYRDSDIDIVFNDFNFRSVFNNSRFKFIHKNRIELLETGDKIDLYFQNLNVGYYHYLKVQDSSYEVNQISELEYIIYLVLDPLLKFSKYHTRHKDQLSRYKPEELQESFRYITTILGRGLADVLYHKIINRDFNISSFFIKKCKFRLLFINNNFVRMIKSRFIRL